MSLVKNKLCHRNYQNMHRTASAKTTHNLGPSINFAEKKTASYQSARLITSAFFIVVFFAWLQPSSCLTTRGSPSPRRDVVIRAASSQYISLTPLLFFLLCVVLSAGPIVICVLLQFVRRPCVAQSPVRAKVFLDILSPKLIGDILGYSVDYVK